jgi:ribosomal protein S12 methylthiotransferase
LVDSISEDGELIGRSEWDAPDVDPIVFLAIAGEDLPQLGQLWRCRVTSASLFDLEATPFELILE